MLTADKITDVPVRDRATAIQLTSIIITEFPECAASHYESASARDEYRVTTNAPRRAVERWVRELGGEQ
jgi:hypothetical protein